jgi:hypothetical protein
MGANPESRKTAIVDFAGFRVRSLRERPGMTVVWTFWLEKAGHDGQGTGWPVTAPVLRPGLNSCVSQAGSLQASFLQVRPG